MRDTLAGKTILITGATGGIGFISAHALADMGATVVIVGRDPARTAEKVAQIQRETGNSSVSALTADLSSMSEVRNLAGTFLGRYPRLDVLLNNAGAVFLSRYTTVDGYERTFALNHLAPFLLTELLLDRLKANAPRRGCGDGWRPGGHRWQVVAAPRWRGCLPGVAPSSCSSMPFNSLADGMRRYSSAGPGPMMSLYRSWP